MAGIDTGRDNAAVSKILRSSSSGRIGGTSSGMALDIVVKQVVKSKQRCTATDGDVRSFGVGNFK
jgi:hypothetical protein